MNSLAQHKYVDGVFTLLYPDSFGGRNEAGTEGFAHDVDDGDVEGHEWHVQLRDGEEPLGYDEERKAIFVHRLILGYLFENALLRKLGTISVLKVLLEHPNI